MAVDPQAGSPFPGLTFAGDLDDLEGLPLEVTMNDLWIGFLGQKMMVELNRLHPGRLAYLRFIPDTAAGMVIIVPGTSSTEYGAVEIQYSETENGAQANLRQALLRLKVVRQPGRVRIFPVITRQAPDGNSYLAFVVKDSATRPARKLKKKNDEQKAGEQKAGEQKAGQQKAGEQGAAASKPAAVEPVAKEVQPDSKVNSAEAK
ncbi:MAG TPA: hypothetical protein VGK74_21905 [Symbiobacteriaceae bacterium]|jgi:hypothetical protein